MSGKYEVNIRISNLEDESYDDILEEIANELSELSFNHDFDFYIGVGVEQ